MLSRSIRVGKRFKCYSPRRIRIPVDNADSYTHYENKNGSNKQKKLFLSFHYLLTFLSLIEIQSGKENLLIFTFFSFITILKKNETTVNDFENHYHLSVDNENLLI